MFRIAPVLAILLSACSANEAQYPWFENNWTAAPVRTSTVNPELQELSGEQLGEVLHAFGNFHWFISGNLLRAEFTENPEWNVEGKFEVLRVDDESFYLITEPTRVLVKRNDSGFCINSGGAPFQCFVPLDN